LNTCLPFLKFPVYLLMVMLLSFFSCPVCNAEEEKTYSISLVKTAEVDKSIRKVGDKKVLTEVHTIKKGEYIYKVLRNKGLLDNRQVAEILHTLKELNASFENLDLVHPGEKIIIPLKILPVGGFQEEISPIEEVKPLKELKDTSFESYTIRPGDTISKVIDARYDISDEDTFKEYLTIVKKLNPSIDNLDRVYPGQFIRLPIYSPQILRKPIKKRPFQEEKGGSLPLGSGKGAVIEAMKQIFLKMGEQWVDSGEHFVPLKSEGQINLKAEAFPIINLKNGIQVICDIGGLLPEKMSKLIQSRWKDYRIIKLAQGDDLRAALEKAFSACNYAGVYKNGKPYKLGKEIPLILTGDWVVVSSEKGPGADPEVAVITLRGKDTPSTPAAVREYLEQVGVRVVDYPEEGETSPDNREITQLDSVNGARELIETILGLSGHSFTSREDIPAVQSEKAGFSVIIKADILFKLKGTEAIIDFSGLSDEMTALLKDHGFSVLTLAEETDPIKMVSRTLDFLSVKYDPSPNYISASAREEKRNIKISLSSIVFSDKQGKRIMATDLEIPEQIKAVLSEKGYTLLKISL